MRYVLIFIVTLLATGAANAASVCESAVQGKLAWDYKGTKDWSPANVAKLCAGSEGSTGPAECFETVMRGGVSWGGGTRWEWQNVVDLCRGAVNPKQRVSCFSGEIAANRPWRDAIARCRDAGGRATYRPDNSTSVGGAPVLRSTPSSTRELTLRQRGTYLANWTLEWTKNSSLAAIEIDENNVVKGTDRKIEIPRYAKVYLKANMVGIGTPTIVDDQVKGYGCITLTGTVFSQDWNWAEKCD